MTSKARKSLIYNPPRNENSERAFRILITFAKTFKYNKHPSYPPDYLVEYIPRGDVMLLNRPQVITLMKLCAERDVVELVEFLLDSGVKLKPFDVVGIMFWTILHNSPTVFTAILTRFALIPELIKPANTFDKLHEFGKYSLATYAIMLGRTQIINLIGPLIVDAINHDKSLVYRFILTIYGVADHMFKLIATRYKDSEYYRSIAWLSNYTKNYGDVDFARQILEKLDAELDTAIVCDNAQYIIFVDRFRAGILSHTSSKLGGLTRAQVISLISRASDVFAVNCIRYLSIRHNIDKKVMFDQKIGNSIRSLIRDYGVSHRQTPVSQINAIFKKTDEDKQLSQYNL